MSSFLVAVLVIIGSMIAVGLYRVFAGPTVFDRLVAVSLLTVNSVVLIVVLGFAFGRPALFLDVALSYALLAFLFPIALARYFERRTTADREARDDRSVAAGSGTLGSGDELRDDPDETDGREPGTDGTGRSR